MTWFVGLSLAQRDASFGRPWVRVVGWERCENIHWRRYRADTNLQRVLSAVRVLLGGFFGVAGELNLHI